MSLLYECINGVVQGGILDGDEGYWEKDEIASLCVGKLRGMIVTDADPNCKYSQIRKNEEKNIKKIIKKRLTSLLYSEICGSSCV